MNNLAEIAKTVAARSVGLGKNVAKSYIASCGLASEIIEEDGMQYYITSDFVAHRIKLVIINERVTEAVVG